ncbi:Uncharacterized protein GBIM_02791 [Gryllus bimaculatus]|nr:Uncharacterized protein GBIM_02791 [Gryllus bimaculatus]
MRPLTAKQIQRVEKKKKKMAAFLEIAKLNDNDRAKAAKHNKGKNLEAMDVEDCLSEPSSSPEGPSRKRHKKGVNLQHGDSNDKHGDSSDIHGDSNVKCGDGKEKHGDMKDNHGDTCTISYEQKIIEENSMEVEGMESGEFSGSALNICSEHEGSFCDKQCNTNVELTSSSKNKKKKVSETYAELKNELRERRSRSKNIPSLRLKTVGELASLSMKEEARTPLLLSDIQYILMYALLGQQAPVWPLRWCILEKQARLSHIIVFVMEGVSLYDFFSHSSSFHFINSTLENQLEVIMPASYNGSLVEELISVPLTGICKERLIQKHGSLDAAVRANGDVYKALRAFFPIESSEDEKDPDLPSSDSFSRTKLLLSVSQLIEQNYPVPMKGELQDRYSDFLLTKDYYKNVTPSSPMFGLDCEMCRTTTGDLEVTRISIVNEKLEVVYESFVKPYNRITDYLTRFSGITKQTLAEVTVRLEDVQRDLRNILPPDAILVGQSLNADLQALKMMHPFVIDTSVIYNITGERNRKSKLSMLSHKFLLEDIQNGNHGHCPVEDSCACIKLTQLKLANGIEYGDAVLLGRRDAEKRRERKAANTQVECNEDFASSIFSHAQRVQKEAAVVSLPERMSDYNHIVLHADGTPNGTSHNVMSRLKCFEESSNEAVVERTCQIALDHHFTLSHIVHPENEDLNTTALVQLDHMCQTLWQHTAVHGLFMVLLGGKGNANGACFASVKKKGLSPGSKL